MRRYFNTAGPCQSDIHYMLSPAARLPQIDRLIAQRNYFIIHAPRQIGKTTAIQALAQNLTSQGHYTAVVVSAETGAAFSHDPILAQSQLLIAWQEAVRFWLPAELQPPDWSHCTTISQALGLWCRHSTRPIALFIDEIDALQDEALVTVLRQLRDGYTRRPTGFPVSVGLIGMRDVRDYKVAAGGQRQIAKL
jgi:AAA domain